MTIPPAGRQGPDEVLAQIGAGGIGEVCPARGAKAGREVAIRLLPAAVLNDAEPSGGTARGLPGAHRSGGVSGAAIPNPDIPDRS